MNRRSFAVVAHYPFNGSTVREPWLIADVEIARGQAGGPSMGPRFENRG